MSRRKKKYTRADLPLLNIKLPMSGVHLKAIQMYWSVEDNETKLIAYVSIGGKPTQSNIVDARVVIERDYAKSNGRTCYSRTATVGFRGAQPGAHITDTEVFRVMPTERNVDKAWAEIIGCVNECAGEVIEQLILDKTKAYYDPNHWAQCRPFRVRFPFATADEPNFKYGEFAPARGVSFDAECDGALMMVPSARVNTGLPEASVARELATSLGCNAHLTGPHKSTEGEIYRIWHRQDMKAADEIDIDDWRARLIAGHGEAW